MTRYQWAPLHDDAPELLRLRTVCRGDVIVTDARGPMVRGEIMDLLLAGRANVLARAAGGDRSPCVIVLYA